MIDKAKCQKDVRDLRTKHAIEATDEQLIAVLHLMNTQGADINAALDQCARSGNDHGIDAWFYDEKGNDLFIYQSKLTESKQLAMNGLSDLKRAREWLEAVLVKGGVESVPSDNHSLFNLFTMLGQKKSDIKRIDFRLISPHESSELEDNIEYQDFEQSLVKSDLNGYLRETLGGSLSFEAEAYNLVPTGAGKIKTYAIPRIPQSRVDLRHNAYLDLAYVTLRSLVDLYRQRGDVLFDKNVRLSLMGTKEARERLVHPMEQTLDDITTGKLSPNIFPFYHLGVTLAASVSTSGLNNELILEKPSIINGCQTIVIAHDYLRKIEKQSKPEALEAFDKIKVIAKVVVGTTSDELKEITNSNNRQNPIENWQLFSNEPIHIEIETTLKEYGVFYERQKGKFDSVMRATDSAKYYINTNGTYIRVMELAQVITLARGMLQWAAKPSETFLNRENHNKVFDRSIPKYPRDMIFGFNLNKALKRGLNTYLELPAHANSGATAVFKKPIIRAHLFYLGYMHFYQSDNRQAARDEFSVHLSKIASARLVDEVQVLYQKVVSKIKQWYWDESKGLATDVSRRKLDSFFSDLAISIGVDEKEGVRPFSPSARHWNNE